MQFDETAADGHRIDMNEPTNFCTFPCDNPDEAARWRKLPPASPPKKDQPRPIPNFPNTSERDRANENAPERRSVTQEAEQVRLSAPTEYQAVEYVEVDHKGDDLLRPPYRIHNNQGNGDLSANTVRTDAQHANGLWEYDVHNVYGTRE